MNRRSAGRVGAARAYPARPLLGMDGECRDARGGPTLAGVWAVHALGGIACRLVIPWELRAYVTLWHRIAGAGHPFAQGGDTAARQREDFHRFVNQTTIVGLSTMLAES